MEIAETFQSQLWIFLNFIFFKKELYCFILCADAAVC